MCQEEHRNVIAASRATRPRDYFQVSAGCSCLDLTRCVTMAMGSEANCSSTVEQHHLKQGMWRNDQEIMTRANEASKIRDEHDVTCQVADVRRPIVADVRSQRFDGDRLRSRILQAWSAQSDWWTPLNAGTGMCQGHSDDETFLEAASSGRCKLAWSQFWDTRM